MKWFFDLSTRAKLILGFGSLWFFMAIVITISYQAIREINLSAQDLNLVDERIALELLQLRSNQNYIRGQILEMMLASDPVQQSEIQQRIIERSQKVDVIIEQLAELNPDPKFQQELAELKNSLSVYRQGREEETSLIREGNVADAQKMGMGALLEQAEKIRALALGMGKDARAHVEEQLAQNIQTARRSIVQFLLAGLAAVVIGALMILLLNRSIASSLGGLTNIAERLAVGDVHVELPSEKRKDEVGVLTQAFEQMIKTLRDMAEVSERIANGDLSVEVHPHSERDLLGNSFQRMLENLRELTSEISESVGMLGSASSEILASTTQVASSAAETASSISETTTTVEEVRQAARLSSDKAKNVANSAQRVAQVSQSGQKAVEESSAGMLHIRDQMETIAQTIVQLSEQSQSIGGIIASVTDLADQSNLLAVNAAIEAARAGEQGKGFAVVAQEIKSLADQSKQATTEIRNILNEVQKTTTAAVMSTEQGSKAVEAGVKQSAQAGEAIQALTGSSTEATQSATQILASSQQQVVGMDQIGVAMENINQAGTQTATSMRQAKLTAQNLDELGQKLKTLVERFQR